MEIGVRILFLFFDKPHYHSIHYCAKFWWLSILSIRWQSTMAKRLVFACLWLTAIMRGMIRVKVFHILPFSKPPVFFPIQWLYAKSDSHDSNVCWQFWSSPIETWRKAVRWTNFTSTSRRLLWMEEILHHLGWLKPYKSWDVYLLSTAQDFFHVSCRAFSWAFTKVS